VLRSGAISDDDYPASALRAEAEGTSVARFTIGPDGRVSSCTASGSGNGALDATTCSLIRSRFRYRPAVGADGNPTSESKTQRVVWRLPRD
jgi:protein TonB